MLNNNKNEVFMKSLINSVVYRQQGDVLITKIEALPSNAKDVTGEQKILQDSETTGNFHRFMPAAPVRIFQTMEAPKNSRTITADFGKFIIVEEESLLYHGKEFDLQPEKFGRGDHHALKIEPGIYRIDIVREYCYDSNEAVKVQD
jgi:hypothetical protein